MKALLFLFLSVSIAFGVRNPIPSKLSSVTISYLAEWDASPDINTVGYRLRFGTFSGIYTQMIDAGNTLSAIMPNLAFGVTYFAVVNSYNTAGVEGPASIEATAGPRPTPTPTATPTPIPLITVSPSNPVFTVTAGQIPPSQSLAVTTSNGADWTSFDTSPWFDARPSGGANNTGPTLFPKSTVQGMSPGTYQENIVFSGSGLPDRTITAKLIISSPGSPTPTIAPSPTPVKSPTPTATPRPQTPTPTATAGPINYTLSISPSSGTIPATGGTITFTVNAVIQPSP